MLIAMIAALAASAQIADTKTTSGHYDVTDALLTAAEYERLQKDASAQVEGHDALRVTLATTNGKASWHAGDTVPVVEKVSYTKDGRSSTDATTKFIGVTIDIEGDRNVRLTDTRHTPTTIAETTLGDGDQPARQTYLTQDDHGRVERHLLTVRRMR